MADKIKLLVVDDEIKFLNSAARRLELRGFDVTRAAGGQEAIDYANERRFDLAILDLRMPGVDGKQVLKVLKERDDLIEVIIMTGHGSADAAMECMKMGAFTYLPKPYELESILVVLRQAYAARLEKKYQANSILMNKLKDLESEPDSVKAMLAMRALSE